LLGGLHNFNDRMVEKRKTARKKMVLPVKFSVAKESLLAHTLDITRFGARLGALRATLQPGTIVDLQRGQKKAKFRVVWVRQLAPNEMQAGVESVDLQENFWGVSLADEGPESKVDMQTFLSLLSDSSNVQTSALHQEEPGNTGGAKLGRMVVPAPPK
jgi:hypothetical protein